MCRVYKIATFSEVFVNLKTNLNEYVCSLTDTKTFRGKIRKIRLERNLNQREFAKLINMGYTTVCNWEQGNKYTTLNTIKKISTILNIDYKYLAKSVDYNCLDE